MTCGQQASWLTGWLTGWLTSLMAAVTAGKGGCIVLSNSRREL